MAKINPPPGFADMEGDASDWPQPVQDGNYHLVRVDAEVGDVWVRKPLPNAIPNLAGTGRADITDGKRAEYMVRFVRQHLRPGEADRLLMAMALDEVPHDTYMRIARHIAVWGTGRPTRPSSISR